MAFAVLAFEGFLDSEFLEFYVQVRTTDANHDLAPHEDDHYA